MPQEHDAIKVSICLSTYNQISTIEKCLQRVIEQEPGFNIEVIVGDDASTDETPLVLKEFARKYPGVVKPIIHEKNLGPSANYLDVHSAAVGDYIAHLDGDDFPLPGKLRLQADFLDNNPDCIAVVHRMVLLDASGKSLTSSWPKRFATERINFSQLVRGQPLFAHSSLMYRKGALDSLFNRQKPKIVIDFEVYILLAQQGMIGAINQDLGEYTVGVGVSTCNNYCNLVVGVMEKARTLGISEEDYRFGLARQFLIFAQKALEDRDYELFESLIHQSVQTGRISARQRLLFSQRERPGLLRFGIRFLKGILR